MDAEEATPALRIAILNVMRTRDVSEHILWAERNKFNLLFMTEYYFNMTQEKRANIIVKQEDGDSCVAVATITEGLQIECRAVSRYHIALKVSSPSMMIHLWYVRPRETEMTQLLVLDKLISHLKAGARRALHTGDLNARTVELGDTRTTTRGKTILEAVKNSNFILLNERGVPTYKQHGSAEGKGTSMIDWTIISPDLANKVKWKAYPSHFGSDHSIIELVILTKPEAEKVTPIMKVSPAAFLKEIKKRTADGNLDKWHDHYMNAVDVAKREASKRRLFEEDGLDHLRSRLDDLNKKLKYDEGSRVEHLQEVKQITEQLKRAKNEAKHAKWVEQVKRTTSTDMYRNLVVKTTDTSSCEYVMTEESRLDGLEAARALVDKFYPDGTQITYQLPEKLPPDDLPITSEEVRITLASFKQNKAPGRSGVDFKLLREWHRKDPGYIRKLFAKWFEEGLFPDQLKESMIKPLVKNKARAATLNNIRPIALTECLARWYEKILDKRLYYHVEKSQRISECQYGYREQKDAITAAEKLIKHRLYCRNKQSDLLIQLDVKAAFDSISHAAVIKALVEFELPGNLIRILNSYLTGRKATVLMAGAEATKQMMAGVPQGSCLGPHLYIITTNAVLKAIENRIQQKRRGASCLISYADDIVLDLSANLGKDEMIQLASEYLDLIAEQLEPLGLQLSMEKTKLMWRTEYPVIETVKIRGKDVETVDTAKILGIHFSHSDDFESHVKTLQQKVEKWMSAQRKLLNNKSGLSHEMRKKLISTVLMPKVTYGASIWWPLLTEKSKSKIKNIARQAMTAVIAGPRDTGYTSGAILSGIMPIDVACEWQAVAHQTLQQTTVEARMTTVQRGHPALRRRRTFIPTVRTPEQIEAIVADVKYFTDGSQTSEDEEKVTGAAFVCFADREAPVAHMLKLGDENTVFQAEMTAIAAALSHSLQNHQKKKIAIFTDSLTSLQAIASSEHRNEVTKRCAELLEQVEEVGTVVQLVHVKAHANLQGNELADAFAKQATKDGMRLHVPAAHAVIKSKSKRDVMEVLSERIDYDTYGRTTKQFFDGLGDPMIKKAAINAFTSLIYTGHGRNLTSHHYGYKNTHDKCSCGQVQSMEHLITNCPNMIEDNIKLATEAGIPVPDFLTEWSTLRKHKNFHRYVAKRAPSLAVELEKLNKLASDTVAIQVALKLLHLTKPAKSGQVGPINNWFRSSTYRPDEVRSDQEIGEEATTLIYSDRGRVMEETEDEIGMTDGALIPLFRGVQPGDVV